MHAMPGAEAPGLRAMLRIDLSTRLMFVKRIMVGVTAGREGDRVARQTAIPRSSSAVQTGRFASRGVELAGAREGALE
jgi:hypothetical protein